VQIHTIGHSNHSFDEFVALLELCNIEQVIDVRSQPYSRRVPQFNREPLRDGLVARGLRYVHLPELGGRSPQAADPSGDQERPGDRGRESEVFRSGLDRLIALAGERSTAIMCAEGDFRRCHRHSLIEPSLRRRGVRILHIERDGTQTESSDNADQLRLV